MFSSQCNRFSLICIVLLFESFWTASNDICVSCIRWINSSALRSVLWNLLEVLCLRFQRCLTLCSLLSVWLLASSHSLKCVNLMILSKIWMNLKCCWCLLVRMKRRIFLAASWIFSQTLLSCDQYHFVSTTKTEKAFYIADFRF